MIGLGLEVEIEVKNDFLVQILAYSAISMSP